ncbi:MAG: hypothetical protein HPY74_03150 [Firmicutes bacterium]|nr:hypothetical protein [Bacillota bacterium]
MDLNTGQRYPKPILFKPDLCDVSKRWDAFFNGDIIDRPIVSVIAPKNGHKIEKTAKQLWMLEERIFGDMDRAIDEVLEAAKSTYYGGEALPSINITFGPDTIAALCGAELEINPDSADTIWAKPFVEDWKKSLPIKLNKECYIWKRLMKFYEKAFEKLGGKMLLTTLDLHTNMDLLAAIRGPQALCMDLLDCPELIDDAMKDAKNIFRELWDVMREAGRMDEYGYVRHDVYSFDGAAILQCDFSIMISPEMFNRWVMPALEEEAEVVKHAMYHWDGLGAIAAHKNSVLNSKGLYIIQVVPGAGNGELIEYLDLLKEIQAVGKAVEVRGSIDQIKIMHKELKPEKAVYHVRASSQDEADEILEWFVKNT